LFYFPLQADSSWVEEDCSHIWHCDGGGSANRTSYGCHESAECKLRNGKRDCYCLPGYRGDGQECQQSKQLTMHCVFIGEKYIIHKCYDYSVVGLRTTMPCGYASLRGLWHRGYRLMLSHGAPTTDSVLLGGWFIFRLSITRLVPLTK
jgi:hypothetical protein